MRSFRTFDEHLPGRRLSRRRGGLVVLELILWLPVLVIGLLAIIEFGLIMQVNRQVAYASRFGAKLAAEITRTSTVSPRLSNFNLSATPGNLKTQIDTYLANHGLTASCEVQLQHNACVGGTSQTHTSTPCNCGPTGPAALPAGEPPAGEAYVRITVCSPLIGNVPNLLSTFGFDLTDRTIEHSTTFRIEANNGTTVPNITANSLNTAGVTGGTAMSSVLLPATNTNFTITVTDAAMMTAAGTVDVLLSGSATDPEDGVLTGASLVWSVNPAAAGLTPTTGTGPITLTLNVPASGSAVAYNLTLTTTDSCLASASRTIVITISHP